MTISVPPEIADIIKNNLVSWDEEASATFVACARNTLIPALNDAVSLNLAERGANFTFDERSSTAAAILNATVFQFIANMAEAIPDACDCPRCTDKRFHGMAKIFLLSLTQMFLGQLELQEETET